MWVTSADLDPNIVQCGEILSRGAIKSYAMSFACTFYELNISTFNTKIEEMTENMNSPSLMISPHCASIE